MNTYEKLIKNFPSQYQPRPIQEKILKKIADGLDKGKNTILLDAGTGVGKSAIAVTLANYFSTAYIVTVTKQLQDQYAEDFNFTVLKGRNNFNCIESLPFGANLHCDEGLCRTSSGNYQCEYGVTTSEKEGIKLAFLDGGGEEWLYRGEPPCNYWKQKADAINDNITLMNYASYFPELNFLPHFGERDLTVFDEAHNLENQIMSQVGLVLSNRKLKRDFKEFAEKDVDFGGFGLSSYSGVPQLQPKDYTDDLDYTIDLIKGFYERYKEMGSRNDLSKKTRLTANRMVDKLHTILHELEKHPKDWVIDPNYDYESISIKPVEVAKFCGRYYFDHSNYNLLMSATILNKRAFAKWHGLKTRDIIYVQVKSPFKVENRPIFLKTVGQMSYKHIEYTKPRTLPIIQDILEKHEGDKGLIHTHNHRLALYLEEELADPRIMVYSFNPNKRKIMNREKVIQEFVDSDDAKVLVAPSVDEGIDLPDDLCRFQIIYKMPFPDLSDKQIKARMKKDRKWYAFKTVTSLVQAYGRGMRNEGDYCETYILDGDIYGVMTEAWRGCMEFLPEYFTEAICDPEGRINQGGRICENFTSKAG